MLFQKFLELLPAFAFWPFLEELVAGIISGLRVCFRLRGRHRVRRFGSLRVRFPFALFREVSIFSTRMASSSSCFFQILALAIPSTWPAASAVRRGRHRDRHRDWPGPSDVAQRLRRSSSRAGRRGLELCITSRGEFLPGGFSRGVLQPVVNATTRITARSNAATMQRFMLISFEAPQGYRCGDRFPM